MVIQLTILSTLRNKFHEMISYQIESMNNNYEREHMIISWAPQVMLNEAGPMLHDQQVITTTTNQSLDSIKFNLLELLQPFKLLHIFPFELFTHYI